MNVPFPTPTKFANRNFWSKGAVRRWRAQIAGEPEPAPQADDEVMINSAQVRALFGGVSAMWLHRRLKTSGAEAA